MRLKLQPVKDILEGIALEDYDRIVAAAERIQALSLDESWMVLQTDEYRRHSDEFRRAVKVTVDAARDRNLDGTTVGYMQMTMNCVRCHRQLRNPE
jgi:cytochrome c556